METTGTFRIDGSTAVQAVATGQPAAMVVPADDDWVPILIYSCPKCGNANGIEVEVSYTRGTGEQPVTTSVCISYPMVAAADFERVRRECERRGLGVRK